MFFLLFFFKKLLLLLLSLLLLLLLVLFYILWNYFNCLSNFLNYQWCLNIVIFSFQSFTPKREKDFLCISSFELLTWKLPEVDYRVLYEWIVEVFSNKFRRF